MLLADGEYEEFEGGYYRLTRTPIKDKQPIAYYDHCGTELGMACLLSRPSACHSCKGAKSDGYYTIIGSFTGWHPLFDFADEFWGIKQWNTNTSREDLVRKAHSNFNGGLGYGFIVEGRDFSTYGLPKPSPKAMDMANSIKQKGKFVTVAPFKRTNGFQARDFTEWPFLIQELKAMGLNVYATCPKKFSYQDLPCEYIDDLAGGNNLMDLELAMHNRAEACFSSNTGSAGLMLYSNTSNLFVFGGVDGFPPGWNGVKDSLAKMEGYRTILHQPSSGIAYVNAAKETISKLKDLLK